MPGNPSTEMQVVQHCWMWGTARSKGRIKGEKVHDSFNYEKSL